MSNRAERGVRASNVALLGIALLTSSVCSSCIPFGAEAPACISSGDCPAAWSCIEAVCLPPIDMLPDRAALPDRDLSIPVDAASDGDLGCDARGFGLCRQGRWDRATCVPLYEPGQVAEGCEANGVDEDCDARIDEGTGVIGEPCLASEVAGVCQDGRRACVDDALVCAPGPSGLELCDGLDNDCDGGIDEAPVVGEGDACGADASGVCADGHQICQGGALVCIPGADDDETCDGLDNDCDGEIDELPPGPTCVPVGADGGEALGLCHLGRMLCLPVEREVDGEPTPFGEMTCVPWLPPADGWQPACNLTDDDCDGRYDEAGEQHVLELPPEALWFDRGAVDRLWQARSDRPEASNPALTGPVIRLDRRPEGVPADAYLPHACLDRGCAAACDDAPDADAHRVCLEAAGCAGAPGVTAWTCGADSVCTVTACGRYFAFDDAGAAARCRPLEVCNNGEDDDGDGLVDATAGDPAACEALIASRGQPNLLGACGGGCEGAPEVIYTNPDELCWPNEAGCPRRVTPTYDYAIDKEEVSLRAYLRCVEEDFCTDPAVAFFERIEEWGRANPPEGRAPPTARPTEDQRNVHTTPVPLDGRGHAVEELLDLPVTGVSWCQARRYCAWAGKRLPTEFEWERAAVGPEAQRRHFPWGDALPPRCPMEDCCVEEGANPPAICLPGQGTPPCPDEVAGPDGIRTWPAAYGMFEPDCVDRLGNIEPGLFPVWSFPAGQTPEGARNMAGNAGEWVYDRMSYAYGTTGAVDPIGAACMPPVGGSESLEAGWTPEQWAAVPVRLPEMRIFRGGMFKNPDYVVRGTNRMPMFSASGVPFLGFRCARTVVDDGLCLPDLPGQHDPSHAEARRRMVDANAAALADCAPDFRTHELAERETCPGRQPDQTPLICTDPQRECTVDDDAELPPPSCGAYVLSALRVDTGQIGLQPGDFLRGEAIGLLDAIFSSALAPAGGTSFLVLDLEEGFLLDDTASAVRFGTAARADGRLRWVGIEGPGGCEPQPVATLSPVRGEATCCGEDADCGNDGNMLFCPATQPTAGRLMLTSMPVGVAFSNLDITIQEGEFRPLDGRIRSGELAFYINGRVASDAWFGSPLLRSDFLYARHMNLPAIDLCLPAARLPGCAPPPGCQGPVCPLADPGNPDSGLDPECGGYFLPFKFEAVRLDVAIAEGLVGGLGNMQCGPVCADR